MSSRHRAPGVAQAHAHPHPVLHLWEAVLSVSTGASAGAAGVVLVGTRGTLLSCISPRLPSLCLWMMEVMDSRWGFPQIREPHTLGTLGAPPCLHPHQVFQQSHPQHAPPTGPTSQQNTAWDPVPSLHPPLPPLGPCRAATRQDCSCRPRQSSLLTHLPSELSS